jgi:hypothetical protein
MSQTSCSGSLPEKIENLPRNSIQRNTSSQNNGNSQQDNNLIQFPDEKIPIENNSIQTKKKKNNIKLNKTFYKSSLIFFQRYFISSIKSF